MLITEQLQSIKSDLATIQTIKSTLQNDIEQNFKDIELQTKQAIATQLLEQNKTNLTNLQGQITNELNTKKTELQSSINASLESVESKLKQALGDFVSAQLLENITNAKQEAIQAIDTDKIAKDIANDDSLKSYITNILDNKTTQLLETLDVSDDVKTLVLDNLDKIRLDEAKIASLQLQNILPSLQENINQNIQESVTKTIDKSMQAQNLNDIIKTLVDQNAKEIVANSILQIQNYNTSLLLNALSQKHTYALMMDIAHKLSNDMYLEDLEQQTLKNNTYIIK